MLKEIITEVENQELYASLNKSFESYKKLMPEKYTSLEMICYVDLMQDKLIPYFEDLAITDGREFNKEDIVLNAHSMWLASLQNGIIDQFCQPIK
jgi:hypothetical protein